MSTKTIYGPDGAPVKEVHPDSGIKDKAGAAYERAKGAVQDLQAGFVRVRCSLVCVETRTTRKPARR